LAVARYLNSRQIAQLVFPGCGERIVQRRLKLLRSPAGAGATIAPLKYRCFNGTPLIVWRLTELGYAKAERALGREIKIPLKDGGHQFLEHAISLNDLYVALATAGGIHRGRRAARCCARPAAVSLGELRLGAPSVDAVPARPRGSADKRLEPDAILESTAAERRWFIECEMGGHSLSNPDEKSGSTFS
jgi:hypothetical protein